VPFTCIEYTGNKRYWTREMVLLGLQRAARVIQGTLPCVDDDYNRIKKGRLDWPPAVRVLEHHHSMARAWIAAGVPMKRVRMYNLDWLPEENEYLLNHAGIKTLVEIAFHLGRTYGAVRKQLQSFHVRARDNEGYLSAQQFAREINCSCDRLRRYLNAGLIKGASFDQIRNRWKIDPALISPEIRDKLVSERRTHQTWPLDVGDYYARYGIKRTKGQRVEVYDKS
jgi:hypothetical protein